MEHTPICRNVSYNFNLVCNRKLLELAIEETSFVLYKPCIALQSIFFSKLELTKHLTTESLLVLFVYGKSTINVLQILPVLFLHLSN